MPTRFRQDAERQKRPAVCSHVLFPPDQNLIFVAAAPPPAWQWGLPPPLAAVFGKQPAHVADAILRLATRITIFTYWLDLNTVPAIDVVAAWHLNYRPDVGDWYGASTQAGLRMIARIVPRSTPGYYDLHLEVYRGDTYLDDDSWHNAFCGDPPKFDSTELHHIYEPGLDANGFHGLSSG